MRRSAIHRDGCATTLAVFALIGFLAGAASQTLVAQRTLAVPGQYATIQAAVIAALQNDVVLVAPGVYRERVDFLGKPITVKSSDGPSVTTIDAERKGTTVTVGYRGVLEGFTITGGRSTSQWAGGGVHVADGTVRDNVITGNEGVTGGGILTQDRSQIVGNLIRGNTASGSPLDLGGGGIAWGGSSANYPVVLRNVIVGNRSMASGGGIACDRNGRIEGNVIAGNTAALDGGGVFCDSAPELSSNVIAGNTAGRNGGGLHLQWFFGGAFNQANNTLYGNHATGNGGGVSLDNAYIDAANWILWANTSGGKGPEIWVAQSSRPRFRHSVVRGGLASVFVEVGGVLTWGPAMHTGDPKFVDAPNGDCHLRADSPYIDLGDGTVHLSTFDFDGHVRTKGATVDIGADEVYPHLYTLGAATPGGTLTIKVVGDPAAPVVWGVSLNRRFRSPPLVVPGVGALALADPFFVVPIGSIPASGALAWQITFPANFPVPMQLPIQALIGTKLSNALIVSVQ